MDKRRLGSNGPEVSAIGLGCMSMTGGYSDKPDRQEMISLIRTDELTEIEDAAAKIQVQGGRYNEAAEQMTNL